ncbi:hypothetical protein QAD02_020872 [Eretmocerus hayati]|uniref:Uncharacterized protein n=1 Tax=Eretmocerus hayati TaxID=131215 RepID=A0ACC2PP52_9HYME|nr:hypothetical protein QAD02_020872 [Eretmocerus hayati]
MDTILYEPSRDSTTSTSDRYKLQVEMIKQQIFQEYTKPMTEDDPSTFLGVNEENMFVLKLLHEVPSVSSRDIYLVLNKIRTNLPFSILGGQFGLSSSQSRRIFKKNVDIIAGYSKQFIVWSSKKDILLNLPISFRYRYSNVQSIIDCFKMEIEKLTNALHQASTWSNHKGCNTDEYLLAVTGDGLITHVSGGVGGRTTDMSIAENCGYLDHLPPGCSVLAERGFKHLELLLQKKNCTLIRPPSVSKDVKST